MSDKAAAAVPFAPAAGLLEDLAGVQLTAKRAGRAAEASGAALAAASRRRAGLIAGRKLVPLPPSPLPDKLYIVIDGTGVPVTAKETSGREGKGEDGRARTREVKMAVFFTQDRLDANGHPVRDRALGLFAAICSRSAAAWSGPAAAFPLLPSPAAGGRSPRRTSPPPRASRLPVVCLRRLLVGGGPVALALCGIPPILAGSHRC